MHWLAVYTDDTTLPQFNPDASQNRYSDIDRERLRCFVVLEGEQPLLVIHIPEGGRLIFRQRVEKVPGGGETRVWLVGCQQTKQGTNSQFVAAIFPDGHIEIVDRFLEDARWFHRPALHPDEGESWAF